MNNLEKWKFFLKDSPSPENFKEMGFYYMIAASLQRRVWLESPERALFPNLYVILCGPPGAGKNQVIKPVSHILKFHKWMDRKNLHGSLGGKKAEGIVEKPEDIVEDIMEKDEDTKNITNNINPRELREQEEKKLMIPMAPDSSTFQALIHEMAFSVRNFYPNLKVYNPKTCCLIKKNCYRYHSLAFALEEISTLFRKDESDLIRFLVKAYDNEDYKHITIGRGTDEINGLCLNLLGGTTPEFMRDAFSSDILNEGFSSRTIFVYSDKENFVWDLGIISDEQRKCYTELILYVFELTKIFGQLHFSKEANAIGREYIENILPFSKINSNPKLKFYYARSAMHLKKLSIAVHFADNPDSLIIKGSSVKTALDILKRLEIDMHKALSVGGRNPTGFIPEKIVKYLKDTGAKTIAELWSEFYKDIARAQDIKDVLQMLESIGKIELITEKHPTKENKIVTKYKVKE